jgi:lipopolysaccharide transport protein LptA
MSLPSAIRALARVTERSGAAVAALTFLSVAAPATHAKTEERPPEITYDASSMQADYKTHMMRWTDITIRYGKMTVQADRALATASDFKNSRWTFDGNVRINAEPRGTLRSDEAVVEFQDNQLKRATATGNPAEFDQKREDSDAVTHGRADQIVYDVAPGIVRLSSDRHPDDRAWVSDGRSDIRSPVIVYNLREERVEATTSSGSTSGPNRRVHVTIDPNEAPKIDSGGTNKPKSADPPKPQSSPPQTAAPQTPAPPSTAPVTERSARESQAGTAASPSTPH